jgi:hypothetical protein
MKARQPTGRDENAFLQKLLDNIYNDDYFLFGSDSRDIATKLFNKCLQDNQQKKDQLLLITADSDTRITSASEQFKNKVVFYSPKITFVIDFTIDAPQDVFLYIRGKTLTPYGIVQQTTRTRNLNDIFYYCEAVGQREIYKNMKELDDSIKSTITHNPL